MVYKFRATSYFDRWWEGRIDDTRTQVISDFIRCKCKDATRGKFINLCLIILRPFRKEGEDCFDKVIENIKWFSD